jgi:hypothetical protein
MPSFSARRYFHELVELLHVNIATFPPSQSVVEDRRTWMMATCSLMIVSLFECLATSFVFADLRLINVYHSLLYWRR